MSQIDNTFIQLRARLRELDIKLWMEPYYFEGVGSIESEMDRLAGDLCGELGISVSNCRCALTEMQDAALRKLAAIDEYGQTGMATFTARCVDDRKGGTSQLLVIKCPLDSLGLDLQKEVAKQVNVSDASHIKCISKGQIIDATKTLAAQNLKNNQHMMVILGGGRVGDQGENLHERIQRIRADVELIARADDCYMEMEDQDGRPIFLPPEENRSLLMAMGMCESARAAMRREHLDEALLLLLEADEFFSYCNSKFLEAVDNYALLNLDIVWCYLCLKNITQLPDAQRRLSICENNFRRSYGDNYERLYALRGPTCPERALIMRLHLLQGVLLFHQNRRDEAYEKLEEAAKSLDELRVNEAHLTALVDMGFEKSDARLALRSCSGNVDRAIQFIQDRREKMEEHRRNSVAARRVNQELRDGNSGAQWIDPRSVCRLIELGYDRALVVEALRRTKNNLEQSMELLQHHREELRANMQSAPVADESLASILQQLGFEITEVRTALQSTNNDLKKAVELLVRSFPSMEGLHQMVAVMGRLLDEHAPSGSNRPASNATPPNFNVSAESLGIIKSVLSQAKREVESYSAFKRFNKHLDGGNSDHLDLPLIQEEQILNEYRSLLER
ncbi:hypothetical protein KR018_004642 [Drosophila ironensis]|nr:hypothetical protein KR018_004642 [Drosophila ironensis]